MFSNAGRTASGIALTLCAMLAWGQSQQETVRFIGEARSLDGSELLYTEKHEQTGSCEGPNWVPRAGRVRYRAPDGELIAQKTIDYSPVPARPSFVLEDYRFDERTEVRNPVDGTAHVTWRAPDGEVTRHKTDIPDNGVIDAGFEPMVHARWDRLVNQGETSEVQFFAPTRGSFYAFEAESTSDERIDSAHVFRIRKTGWISSWFIDALYLGFNRHRQLTDYLGRTNILKTPESNHVAHIHYSHLDPPPCQ